MTSSKKRDPVLWKVQEGGSEKIKISKYLHARREISGRRQRHRALVADIVAGDAEPGEAAVAYVFLAVILTLAIFYKL